MYVVGYLQPYTTDTNETEARIINPMRCHTGDEIIWAVKELCQHIGYDIDTYFAPDTWAFLKDTTRFEHDYYATIDLYGSHVLDVIVGSEEALRERYLIEE